MTPLAEVVIAPKTEGKGRSFRALHLCSVTADGLWPGGQTDTDDARPVYASFLGSDDELKPFMANLSCGRKALLPNQTYGRRSRSGGGLEFLRSAGYKVFWQRCSEGSVATVYLPDLHALDPGMVDPLEAKFVLLPPWAWAAKQTGIDVEGVVRHARRLPHVRKLNTPPKEAWARERWEAPLPPEKLAALAPVAYLFAAYLDRRTRAPIPTDGRLYLQVMLACLRDGLASWACEARGSYSRESFGEHGALGFDEDGTDLAGMLPGVAFKATHDKVEALLSDEIQEFYAMTEGT